MDRKSYTLELTEIEVRGIGKDRWIRGLGWRFAMGFAGVAVWLVFLSWLFQIKLANNTPFDIIGGVLVFLSLVGAWLWFYWKMRKAGKEYLKEVTN